jgi:hypothetical protein
VEKVVTTIQDSALSDHCPRPLPDLVGGVCLLMPLEKILYRGMVSWFSPHLVSPRRLSRAARRFYTTMNSVKECKETCVPLIATELRSLSKSLMAILLTT